MSSQEGRSPWFWVFVGCGGLTLIAIIGIGVLAFGTIRFAKNVEKGMKDPKVRTEQGLSTLGATELPPGYRVSMSFEAPFGVGSMVMLSDDPEPEGETPSFDGEHMFIYMMGPGWDSDWKKFIDGGEPPLDSLDELNVNIGDQRPLQKGQFEVFGGEAFYSAARGEISGDGFDQDDGIFSIVLIRCTSGDKKSRTAIWAGPPAETDEALEGTTADAATLQSFFSYFKLCEE